MTAERNPHGFPDRIIGEERHIRERAADHAQLRIRNARDFLIAARHALTIVVTSQAPQDVIEAADEARACLDNADQAVGVALRFAIDASGMIEVVEPVAKHHAETMESFQRFIGRG